MTKLSIYSDAQKQIERCLSVFTSEHHFNSEETAYKVLLVENEKVIFQIHQKLKELVEQQYHILYGNDRKKVTFKKMGSFWKIIFETGGDESYIFANLLLNSIKSMDEAKKVRVNRGKAIIEDAVKKYLRNRDVKKQPRIWYKNGLFHAKFLINSMSVDVVNASPQTVAQEILEKLPEFE
ncbi:MAG: hypothetical protein ACD_56C00065G0002 [uncultured bacterium]|nr:MAG: hypothetical protein ACD_56C00065G0002 [uncultured bacterium]